MGRPGLWEREGGGRALEVAPTDKNESIYYTTILHQGRALESIRTDL